MRKAFRITGFIAVALALAGFFTVADDLTHTGELIGVAGLLLAGLALLGAGFECRMNGRLAPQWIAAGVGVGAACGAGMDNMAQGVGAGAALGVLLAFLFRGQSTAPCGSQPSAISS